ncbi:MAG: Lon-like protease [Actinomycetota bacterium]|jgi:PDZ domain-containing protein|nr:Lon-like protease [Actinomycetota bacterium]
MDREPWALPNQPGMDPVKGVHPWLWIVTAALCVSLMAAAFFVPVPIFFAYLPGPVRDVEKLIKVTDARTYSSEGSLYLTTVSVDTQVTVFDIVSGLFDDEKSIVMQEDVTGGESLKQLQKEQQQQIIESKRYAQQVALSALGLAKPHGDGARITGILENSPAVGKLKPGDLIVSVDGSPVETPCDVGRSVDAVELGDEISLVVRRKGQTETVTFKTIENPEDPTSSFLGIAMEPVNYQFDPGLKVEFATGEIAGPSAGLMFSLALYDRLTPEDLTAGRRIAGTGTIACDGGVGPIGGIEQKVAGAQHKGAEIFLAPQANAAAAKAVADDIEIVPISTFDDAVEYLEGLQ